jgi:hypothetical protein
MWEMLSIPIYLRGGASDSSEEAVVLHVSQNETAGASPGFIRYKCCGAFVTATDIVNECTDFVCTNVFFGL